MGYLSTIEYGQQYLFANVAEMQEAGVPDIIQQRLIRLRDMYNIWLNNPSMKDAQIVRRLMEQYGIAKTAAYEDVRIIKFLLGDLNKATKDYHRYRFIQRNEETYSLAKSIKDARAMAAADNHYGKYMQLNIPDEEDYGYDKIVVQPFIPTTDPTVIGLKPIPNIREKIAKKLKQYIDEDIQDIEFEAAELDAEIPDDEEGDE